MYWIKHFPGLYQESDFGNKHIVKIIFVLNKIGTFGLFMYVTCHFQSMEIII